MQILASIEEAAAIIEGSTPLLTQLITLIKALNSRTVPRRGLTLTPFLTELHKSSPLFEAGKEHDTHEFLGYLLTKIREESQNLAKLF